jgi:hypothetical protein
MAPLDRSIPQKLLKVRRLEAHDVADYRELRLEGLKGHPAAFLSSWEDEADKPVAWWTERLENNTVFGGWIDDSFLLGVAGLRVHDAAKLRQSSVKNAAFRLERAEAWRSGRRGLGATKA